MSVATLGTIAQQVEQLAPEDKWALLSLLIESLRRPTALPMPLYKHCDRFLTNDGHLKASPKVPVTVLGEAAVSSQGLG